MEPDGLKTDLKHLEMGATKTLELECGRTNGLFQELGSSSACLRDWRIQGALAMAWE